MISISKPRRRVGKNTSWVGCGVVLGKGFFCGGKGEWGF